MSVQLPGEEGRQRKEEEKQHLIFTVIVVPLRCAIFVRTIFFFFMGQQ